VRNLVVAPNWIGDAIMAQPLLALLKSNDKNGQIDVLAPAHIVPVFEAMAEVNEVIVAPQSPGKLQLRERLSLAGRLRRLGYERCYVLPNSMKSALVPWLAGIPVRIGHRGEARYWLINRSYDAQGSHRPPMVEHYARLAFAQQQVMPSGVPNPVLSRNTVRESAILARYNINPSDPIVVLCPGAEFGPAKRWPARHYASLAALVCAEWPEANVVLLGSNKDRTLATEIAALSGQPLRNLCGDTTLTEAMAIISRASSVVSNDSGLMHIAAAFGRPQVAVFGSSDPRHTPPRSTRAKVEWLHLECSPCFERECPLGHTNCLNLISPLNVFESLKKVMRFETSTRGPR
jgi:heptosyltransferase II